jgi:sigma-B regulation protein RsbU (phosphoserine phosphatase)
VAVPLLVPDRVLGVMDLESTRIGYFTEEHVRTLSLLAPLVANSLENARLYEELGERERRLAEDLGAARDLQEALLLRPAPEIEGLDVAARCRPAREISGDLYDFFEHSAGMDIVAFGDVSGKGAAAALYSALAAGLLRTLAPRRTTPGGLLRSLNDALGERKVHATYIALLVLFWRAGARLFTMANAGAMPPVICRRGRILNERVEGVPLGLLDDRVYDELTLHAEPGDAVLLYSDGVHDQLDPSGEEYGRRPLHRLLRRLWDRPADEIAGEVFADLDRFRSGAGITDDQTVIVLKVK